MCLAVAGRIVSIASLAPQTATPQTATAVPAQAQPDTSQPDTAQPAAAAAADDADDALWRQAEVDFGGVRQQVSLACLPEARVGDRVLVHVGLALSLVLEDEADSHDPQRQVP